ncbi:hypothetical protein O6H91_11G031900 [Diphasiastrum complanatum]|uniref:Uncharacterized protein n=1 Tax=Diphasiastrum complanatum TaxID=34168 RepID=A0ACC2C7L0_DIPCM|nr:hypothetical protein O6H91_11G031900 [Diphasiastrum complanatum]
MSEHLEDIHLEPEVGESSTQNEDEDTSSNNDNLVLEEEYEVNLNTSMREDDLAITADEGDVTKHEIELIDKIRKRGYYGGDTRESLDEIDNTHKIRVNPPESVPTPTPTMIRRATVCHKTWG